MNIDIHKKRTESLNHIYRPELFRLENPSDKKHFQSLLAAEHVFVHDEIEGQLRELIKSRHPSRQLGSAEIECLLAEHTASSPNAYGVWIYYPWNARLVHLLDKDEFTEVRTSRNKYKITGEEQKLLSKKKVGVIGLSVGQSVAVTMAMERAFGEIRLADFDILELTNLNRIRTGISNLGLKKVIMTAREIAEIDPFLKVSVFDEGLTEQNIEAFLTEGGKLDVLIDECDGVEMKIMCRRAARELQIPVLMEASDRCTIDVERFDLDPSRSLLHGYIDHLDISRLKHLKTNEEKIPYLAPMVGIETMSVRLKASAMEVGHSITTWPQLASAVVMGGGALADIWRRIALDQFRDSGRYFIDMEELTAGKTDLQAPEAPDGLQQLSVKPLTLSDMRLTAERYLNHLGGRKSSSSDDGKTGLGEATVSPEEYQIRELVGAAAMAPSGGNSQPWKWVFKNGILFLFLDKREGYSYMNFRETASYIALGAAIENLVLKAHQRGIGVKGDYFPSPEDDTLVAAFSFHESGDDLEPIIDRDLAGYIEKRHTNRKFPSRVLLPEEHLSQLKNLAESIPGVRLVFIDAIDDIMETGKIIGVTDRYRILNPESNYDFIHREMRWTEHEASSTRTGMDVNTLELRESEVIGLRFIRNPEVVSFISKINGGHLLKNASVKNAAAASVFGLLTVPSFSDLHFLNGGRVSQRLWLKATQLGLAFHPMNVPLTYFQRLKYDSGSLPPGTEEELQTLYTTFARIFGNSRKQEEVCLFRLFKADEPCRKSLRKRTDEILSYI